MVMVKTNREKFLEKHKLGDVSLSMREVADLSGMPLRALEEVYARGIGAYRGNPKSVRLKGSFKKNVDAPMSMKLSPQQWAMARVYSFVMKQAGTYGKADRDIREKFNL